jgi:outer membrane protein OmpA-like peptidoglycan-associated protein
VQLKGGAELAVGSADFDVAAVAPADAQGWELRIVDAGGKTVKTIQGQGRPPKAVHWEGTDDLGQPLSASLGASYEIRVTDAGGAQRLAAAAPVVAPAAFADLAQKAQERLPEAPKSYCRRDAATGAMRCVIYFQEGAAGIPAQGVKVLADTLASAGHQAFRKVRLTGYASAQEGVRRPAALAQSRADEVLRQLVEQGGLKLKDATAEGRVQAGGQGRVELTVGAQPAAH